MYESLSIPSHRLDYIDLSLKSFICMFDIKKWPIDCVVLLKEMKNSKKYPVTIGALKNVSKEFDAVSQYIPETGVYHIVFNRAKIRYPFRKSSDRRLNFTIAHEIDHIVLEHLSVPDELKSEEERYIEDLEADEFAGRLLMPQRLIFSCNYYSVDSVAAFMNVSVAALKKRLEKLDKIDIVKSRKIKNCPQCGNYQFSSFAEYCGICGHYIRGPLKGIQRIIYPDEVLMDKYKRALFCPRCRKDLSRNVGDKCASCGTYIFNLCSDEKNGNCSAANLGNARYCEMCGNPTYYYLRGFIRPWQDALYSEYRSAIAEEQSPYTVNR